MNLNLNFFRITFWKKEAGRGGVGEKERGRKEERKTKKKGRRIREGKVGDREVEEERCIRKKGKEGYRGERA